jgi:hypothetical protein
MTSLEIVRLDTQPNGSVPSSPNKLDTNQSRKSLSINVAANNRLSSYSNTSNNIHEIPISIIKSPSFNNQLEMKNDISSQKSPNLSISLLNSKEKNNLDNSFQDSEFVDNGSSQMSGTLRFNKYGFAQVVNETNINTLKSNDKNDSQNNVNNNNNSNQDDTISNSNIVVTNLKDYLQNADVEMFSENIPIKVIQSRELKWVEMLNNFNEWMKKRFDKIKSRCRKGIPQSMRSKAWMHLTGAILLKKQKPDYYQECLTNPNNLDISKYVEDIKKDLHRQFPNHEIFMKKEGRQSLYNVLKAYAVHNKEVGYCQAQGPIAALLLMHMAEEDSFWMLVRISDTYLNEYFKPGLEKVQIDGHALFYLFKKENQVAHKLLKQQSIDPILYMTEWFMCIYARTLPWCTVLRVWDMFFCEGIKVLYRVGLYLMQTAFSDKQKLEKCQQQGMYETLNLLKNLQVESLTEHNLVKKSCMIKITEQDLNKAFEKSKVEFIKQTQELQANRKQPPDYKNPKKK